jgi:hypothetical protein
MNPRPFRAGEMSTCLFDGLMQANELYFPCLRVRNRKSLNIEQS